MPKTLKKLCIGLLVLGILSFAYPVLAQDSSTLSSSSCHKGNVYCEYPGQCHDYIDSNNDNYCDRSIPTSGAGSGTTAISIAPVNSGYVEKDVTVASSNASTSANNSSSGVVSAPGNSPDSDSRYNLLLIMIILIIAYGITYFLSIKKIIKSSLHMKIWNIALLVSAAIMLILGLLLTLREEYNISIQVPFDMTFWHVETGIIMGIIAVFHIAWHWRYYFRIKPAARNDH
ncbi:MAG: hypothetical protein PHY03_03740 [Dehalococcoidia bacterium]|nr:hypothetical protein [Dehalococcoidia bacterium]